MKKLFISGMILLLSGILHAQEFTVEKVSGNVKAQIGVNEEFIQVKEGMKLQKNTMLLTEKNSLLSISGTGVRFTLKPSAALNLSDLRKMTLDELLLALALEELLDADGKGGKQQLKNTAIYGSENAGNKGYSNNELGILKLNGAMQLAEEGFTENSIVVAKEAFRKYPSTKNMVSYRLYFAAELMKLSLWKEALEEYSAINKLSLQEKEKQQVAAQISIINKNLSSKK